MTELPVFAKLIIFVTKTTIFCDKSHIYIRVPLIRFDKKVHYPIPFHFSYTNIAMPSS